MILVVNQRKAELLAKETIVRETVIELVVVCGGIAVLVPVKGILFSVEFEEGLDRIVNQGLYKTGPEAAIILGVVGQKDWAVGPSAPPNAESPSRQENLSPTARCHPCRRSASLPLAARSEEKPATGLLTFTRSSSELKVMVCHPPPDNPVTPMRLRSTLGWL